VDSKNIIILVIAILAFTGLMEIIGPYIFQPPELRNAPQQYQNPRYAAPEGDCFVPPQGDPLWDAHYAKEVNQYNCEAYQAQEEAQAKPNVNSMFTKFVWLFLGALVIVFGGAYLITR
jgi:hypothetical protein